MDILGRLKVYLRQALALPLGASLLFAMPASTNYQLKDFGYGGGGVANSASSNYAIEGIVGEQNATRLDGVTYDLGPGLQFTNQANVPPAPAFTNPSNYYNKLALTLATGDNPTDTLFAIAISTDDFVTTNYVQSDNTVGATLGLEDYQTYSAWGGGSGFTVIGLAASTTYKVKVKAWQGKFTETGYGPEVSAATVGARLTFDIDVSASNSETSAPYATDIGDLIAGTVTDSPEKVWVDFDTNGESGGRVYVVASNAGLQSSRAGYTISTVTGNLTSLSEGFGAQSDTVANGLSEVALYNQTGNMVGTVDTTIREVFTAAGPTTSGRGSFLLKAKSSAVTPAASDYTETLTILASASF